MRRHSVYALTSHASVGARGLPRARTLAYATSACVADIKKEAEICVDFTKIAINTSFVGACVQLEVDLLKVKVLDVDVGCFHFNV